VLLGAHAANRSRLEARLTVDVALLASTLDGAADVLRELGCDVWVVTDGGVDYPLSARRGPIVLDVLLAETEYQRIALARAVDGVLTVEDVIIHKLIAGRPLVGAHRRLTGDPSRALRGDQPDRRCPGGLAFLTGRCGRRTPWRSSSR
jgi:hypothetical protein